MDSLTAREMDVFRLITQGLSNAEIGQELFISDTTVKTHVTRLLQKLDLRDRAQAIVLAYQTGLFDASETRPRRPTVRADAARPGPRSYLRRTRSRRLVATSATSRRRADAAPFLASRHARQPRQGATP